MMNVRKDILMVVLLLLLGAQWPAGAAEKSRLSTSTVSQEVLESKIKEVEATTSLDEISRKNLTELYQKALTNLERARSDEADAESFSQARNIAPAETKKLRDALKQKQKISAEKSLRVSDKTPLLELEQLLLKEKADLAAVEAKLADLNNLFEVQTGRPGIARERLIAAKRQQDSLNDEYAAVAPAGELAAMTQARKWVLETQAFALSAEIKMLDRELLSYQPRMDVLKAERGVIENNAHFVTTRVRLLEELLSKLRLAEAEQAQQQAEAVQVEFRDKHPLVRKLAELNVVLGEELKTRALELEQISAEDDQARTSAKRIGDDLSSIKQKLEIAGMSQALGRVLIEQRRSLPKLSRMRWKAGKREKLIANAGLRQIQYNEEQQGLRDTGAYITSLTQDLPESEANAIGGELEELVTNRLGLLEKAIATEASYLRTLGELDLAQSELINVVEEYDTFLGKRILWIRSTEPITPSLFKSLPRELAGLFSPLNWFVVGKDLLQQFGASPLGTLPILVFAVLTFLRRRFLKAAVAAGKQIRHIRTDSFSYTLQTLGWTILASAPLPLLVMTTGWQLSLAPEASEFAKAVAAGLLGLAHDFLLLLFFADVCVAGGLVVRHFRWPAASAAKLRKEFSLLMALFLPSVFIIIYSLQLDQIGYSSGLTILAVLAAIGSLGLFEFRIFSPGGGVLADFMKQHPRSLLARLRTFWLGFLVVLIVGLMGLVLAGYLYTGGTLTRHLISTLWLIYFLLLGSGLVVRWLLLVSRRLALQAALERREVARVARAAEETRENTSASGEDTLEIEEPEVDLAALGADSLKLIKTAILFSGLIGLWLIWSPVLPAFSALYDVALWSHTAMLNGIETVVPVTLEDLALAIIIGIITTVAARGIPAFLEFILLQRIGITTSGRYTATTLLRYVIIGVGMVLFLNILGVNWSKVQWLVAALSVGIGFGLQEIIANFISGLIILFERPIRVGDTVTVGDVTGVVSRINIRATTITNWDRQELLVPNKEFITTRLLNWSLSDPIIRIVIPVGIAYGSDVSMAMELMKEAAKEHENVLDAPATSVTFESFGDNALNLYLRAFLPSLENRMGTITDLHSAINRKFNDAGIVIAFPQRDVHLDTSRPLDIRLHREPENQE